jgi:hypothetical protein
MKNITINSFREYISKRLSPIITQLNNGQSITKTFEIPLPPSGYDFVSLMEIHLWLIITMKRNKFYNK